MRVIEIRKFDGIGAEVDYDTILLRHIDAARIELYREEEIIKLNIRFDEVFHRCKGNEWDDFKTFLSGNGIPIKTNRWWQFWER